MSGKHCHGMGRGPCKEPCCPVHSVRIPAPEAARRIITLGIERYVAVEEEFVAAAEDTNRHMLAAKQPPMFDSEAIEDSRVQGKLGREFLNLLAHYDVHLSRRKPSTG